MSCERAVAKITTITDTLAAQPDGHLWLKFRSKAPALVALCSHDAWAADVRACLANVRDLDAFKACATWLSDDQLQAFGQLLVDVLGPAQAN